MRVTKDRFAPPGRRTRVQFGEQLWLKRDPRLWRAPSRPKVLAQYLFGCVGGAAGTERRQTGGKKKSG